MMRCLRACDNDDADNDDDDKDDDDDDNDDDDKDDDDDDEVLGVRCLSAGEHANPQSGEHQSCRPRGGSMH